MDLEIIRSRIGFEILNSGKIKIQEPAFATVLECDRAHAYGLLGMYDEMAASFDKMKLLMAENPIRNKVGSDEFYLKGARMLYYGHKHKAAREFIPQPVAAQFKGQVKKSYSSLMELIDSQLKEKE